MTSSALTLADHVAGKVSRLIGQPRWLMGIAIVRDDQGYAVSVRYSGRRPRLKIPRKIDGVRIRFDRREMAKPRRRT